MKTLIFTSSFSALLVTTLLTSVASAEIDCHALFINNPTAVTASTGSPDVPGPQLNNRGAYAPVVLPSGLTVPPAAQHHIFHGDFKMIKPDGTNRVPGLEGGMHTPRAFAQFLEWRPDIKAILDANPKLYRRADNGVVRVVLPPDAGEVHHAGGTHHGGEPIIKTMFPENWTDAHILSAIDEAARTGTPTKDEPSKVIATVDGVIVNLILVHDQQNNLVVKSFYPAGSQNPQGTAPDARHAAPAAPIQ